MSGVEDAIVTIHALERMEERFPDVVAGMSDRQAGELIYGEVIDAIEAGRKSAVPPLALAPQLEDRWWPLRQKGSYCVWTADKLRGYVVHDHPEEGMLIITVLRGEPDRRRWSRVGRR